MFKQMLKEFREFAIKGNALDLAVGVMIGAAFGQVINSLVADVFTPLISLIIGKVDFSTWVIGLPGDSVIRFGLFLNALINFLIVAFGIFLVIRQLNKFNRSPQPAEPNEKECGFCKMKIPIKATRCPNCTSELLGSM